jgi:Transcriptional regulator, AbiEi antitoxin, Type IV TA system/Transcriptional regulator, AbiEi antitoxin N-terminal domain
LQPVGKGAMCRAGSGIYYEGAICALQQQSKWSIHPGGRTALAYLGKAHYQDLSMKKAVVFGDGNERLPKWFTGYDWGIAIHYHPTTFLPPDLGLEVFPVKDFSIKVSGAARALMECLYLAPEEQDLMECMQVMEGLNNLRPNQVQALLEQCRSIKVKRLFLFMAEKAGHRWLNHLKPDKIDLGFGKRSIVERGTYDAKYQITISKELADYGK